MSFTQALPANIVKLVYRPELFPTRDFAKARELARLLLQVYQAGAYGVLYRNAVLQADRAAGVSAPPAFVAEDVAKLLLETFITIPGRDASASADAHVISLLQEALALGLETVATRTFAQRLGAVGRTAHRIGVFVRETRRGVDGYTPYTTRVETPSDALDVSRMWRQKYADVATKLAVGMYAYASHWNDLYDYAVAIVDLASAIVSALKRKYESNSAFIELIETNITPVLEETWRCLQDYERLRTGDIIQPEHTNKLIDIAACIDRLRNALIVLGRARIIFSMTGAELARLGYATTQIIASEDVTSGIDAEMWTGPPEIVVAYPWTWWDYRCLITDDTLFISTVWDWEPGTTLLQYLERYRFVFGFMVYSQLCEGPYGSPTANPFLYPVETGWFDFCECFTYGTRRYVYPCDGGDVLDSCLSRYISLKPAWTWSSVDYAVDTCVADDWKAPDVTKWYCKYEDMRCCYVYKRVGRGYVIELPWNRMFENTDVLLRYIEGLSKCLLGVWPPKRVVMHVPESKWPELHPEWFEYPTFRETAEALAQKLNWNYRYVRPGVCR